MEDKTVKCLNCSNEFTVTESFQDISGWHSICPKCNNLFNIDIKQHLIPNGTHVYFNNDETKHIYIVDGNDSEESDKFNDINYNLCAIEFIHEETWSDHYEYAFVNEISAV